MENWGFVDERELQGWKEGVGAVGGEGFGVGVGPGPAADGGITKEDFSGIDAEALARCQGSGEGA